MYGDSINFLVQNIWFFLLECTIFCNYIFMKQREIACIPISYPKHTGFQSHCYRIFNDEKLMDARQNATHLGEILYVTHRKKIDS